MSNGAHPPSAACAPLQPDPFPASPFLFRPCADVAARLAQREEVDVHQKRKLSGRREGTVLDPCRLALDFTLVAGAEAGGPGAPLGSSPPLGVRQAAWHAAWLSTLPCTGPVLNALSWLCAEGSASSTDVKLEASDLRLTLSPDVLELGSQLAASVLEPLRQVCVEGTAALCLGFGACRKGSAVCRNQSELSQAACRHFLSLCFQAAPCTPYRLHCAAPARPAAHILQPV